MNARKVRLVGNNSNSCPKCGARDIASRTYADTVAFRNLEFNVEGLLDSTCQHCGYIWSTSDQETQNHALIRRVYAAERDRLRAEQGLLSGQEIAEIRELLELNQREAAAIFGGGYNAFNKYESGEVLQSFAMDRLLRLTKVVGKPAVVFLKNVDNQPSFTVISTATLSTTSDTSYMALPLPERFSKLLRNIQTATSSAVDSNVYQPYQVFRNPFGNKHENYALSR